MSPPAWGKEKLAPTEGVKQEPVRATTATTAMAPPSFCLEGLCRSSGLHAHVIPGHLLAETQSLSLAFKKLYQKMQTFY